MVIDFLLAGCSKDQFCTDCGSFKDSRDKHVYKWVQIGEQIWMSENIAYLPAVSPSTERSETDARYYIYDYEGSSVPVAKSNLNFITYGVLYNWVAAKTACLAGWHLPSDAEWTALTSYLGEPAGGKMKENGDSHWESPNLGATNESGFTALPGGCRYYDGGFTHLSVNATFWTASDEGETSHAWHRWVTDNDSKLYRDFDYKSYGFSVRCLRD